MTLSLPIPADANDLLSRSPLALLIGMLLDQQVTIEKAFTSPRDLVARLGHEPTAAELAGFAPDALAAIFSERPALHRYPRAMAGRVQQLSQHLVDHYQGEPASLWRGVASGAELLAPPDLFQPAPLGGVEHQVGAHRDGDRDGDHRQPQPRVDEQQDEANDDDGDGQLHATRH